MSKLLEIQPKELRFTVESKKQSMCLVRLTNITSYYVAFKVKTTSPKRYCVKPNVGIVMPNSSYDFTVLMQVPKSIEYECKDKFLIQSTTVAAETTDEDITARMFIREGGNYVEEKKLKVILVVPSDSPTLSPINGALGQGLDRETSYFREQPVDKPENLSKQHMVIEDREEPVLASIKASKTEDDKKLKPMKSVLFKLENDVAELKPEKHVGELKPAKQVEVLSPAKEIEELKPVTNVEELRPSKYVEELKPMMNNVVEELSSAKHVEELYPATAKEESKPAKNVEELKPAMNVEELKPAMNVEELKPAIEAGFKTVGDVELKLEKAVELKSTRAVEDDSYLAKDVKEIKSKLGEFELKLSKAEFAISKLMVERNSNIEERKHLHERLAALSKRDVKQVQVGFPLLFVLMVALIGIVLGYRLHP